ncbi:MAG: tetratricopeptide repeat protein, partial [Gammaproteobacteria bacterium]|nr:tetratricopeptide repeat protein [Gammaproteobacteria bacterium]
MKNFIAGLLGVLIALPAWSADQLLDIPHPILDEYKPEVRAMLAGARGRFELMSLEATGPDLGLAYGRLGIHYYAHAEQDAARACFVNATALDPDNFRWPYYLAVHYAETGAFARAVRVFDRVLALQPGDVPTLTRLGLALLELDRVDEAETRLKAAIVAQPANAAAFAGLARVAERRDDWE